MFKFTETIVKKLFQEFEEDNDENLANFHKNCFVRNLLQAEPFLQDCSVLHDPLTPKFYILRNKKM